MLSTCQPSFLTPSAVYRALCDGDFAYPSKDNELQALLFLDLVTKSCPTLASSWTVACRAPLPLGFSRHEYWSGLPFPSPGDLPDPGIEPGSLALQAGSLLLSHKAVVAVDTL